MMIEDITIPRVAKLPVQISGNWAPPPKRDWRGFAIADEPIVAVTFLRCEGHIEWCLSERQNVNMIEVRLALFPYDKNGVDVSVNVCIGGGGRRYRSLLQSFEYRPEIPLTDSFETGHIVCISRIQSEPSIDFLGLFLARRDVKIARCGIWHLRPRLRAGVPNQLSMVLSYGRTGRLEEEKKMG